MNMTAGRILDHWLYRSIMFNDHAVNASRRNDHHAATHARAELANARTGVADSWAAWYIACGIPLDLIHPATGKLLGTK